MIGYATRGTNSRGESFYTGYFRDPDGNKPSVFCVG